ncbi:TetR/AcrR family transcriptional regulator [Rhizobium sp. UBA1881]|jgi:AcrR family transcriptional regulator|uniref:TetR/AcrR family transcriptional regulator n=1 Tax=Rhizobium sp. UBA1881 TaxID=1947375 RepID=UPI0025EF9FE3|nr:TetR/AcrR family transcriptional regulator [Rhizobium sp. UBA1881]
MARHKEFDKEEALDAALAVFREHGFAGTSTPMLTDRMRIGRQSLYDTYGDKWQLYLAALNRYGRQEISAHVSTLMSKQKAIEGIEAMIDRVVREARQSCLGVNSICEFGDRNEDINVIHASSNRLLQAALVGRIKEAQRDGDVAIELDPSSVVDYLVASFAGIRIAARGGANDVQLATLGKMAVRGMH